MPDFLEKKTAQLSAAIINIHWICAGFLRIETLQKFKQPIVWMLHDMWPFTGGCHYALDCEKYHDRCGSCPQLGSRKEYDLSRWIWKRKQSAWKNLNLTVVATSNWMAECARSSSLFSEARIEVISIGLDSERFKPVDKVTCRNLWGFQQDKKIILFGGGTQISYKGFDLLIGALKDLSRNGFMRDKELVIFGSPILSNPPDYGFSTRYLGVLSDDVSLVSLYSSADVTVVPSIQESFGQVASESLACGTPVVAFDAQGPKDIVDHKTNGYLSRPYEIDDLANGIAWVLSDSDKWQELSWHAREKVEREFTIELQARRYLKLYEDILS